MADQRVIAGILLAPMIPVAPPPKFDMATEQFDLTSVMKSAKVVDLTIQLYQMMVAVLTAHSNKTTEDRSEIMRTPDHQQDWTSETDREPPMTGAAGHEIIAAIITAGMLPTLPVPKLHRLAEGISEPELRPAVGIVASALHLYSNVLQTIRYAEARLEQKRRRSPQAR
jgi:hypothetical protein